MAKQTNPSFGMRPGTSMLSCFNSGCEFWFYDESFLPELKTEDLIRTLVDDGLDDFEQRARPYVKRGCFVGVSMEGDGSVNVAVMVGEPLKKNELKSGHWLKPQKAFISIPSGKLILESNDSLRWGYNKPLDKGARAKVPPGDYVLTLYRADFSVPNPESEELTVIPFVVSLTPLKKKLTVKGQSALLPFVPRVSPVPTYSISGGRLRGKVMFDSFWDTLLIAIDAEAPKTMGIRDGDTLTLKTDGIPFETKIVYLENTGLGNMWERVGTVKPPKGAKSEWAWAYLLEMEQFSREVLFCMRQDAKTCIEEKDQNRWIEMILEK